MKGGVKMLSFRSVILLGLILLLNGTVAFAQYQPGQWLGDFYSVNQDLLNTTKFLIDENNVIQKTIPHLAKDVDFPVPHKYKDRVQLSYWHKDALYTCAEGSGSHETDEKGNILFKRHIFAKREDDKWHFLGEYRSNPGELLIAIPCDNGRFIIVSNTKDQINDNRLDRTPFSVMSVVAGKNEIRVERSIDHGQDELRKYMSTPEVFKLSWVPSIVMTDTHGVIVNKQTGLYWVFSLKNASLVKAGNIFTKETAKMVTEGGFTNSPILCANPEKKGTVLIAAQEERFFTTEARNFWQEYNKLQNTEPYRRMSNEDVHEKLYDPMRKEFIDRSPFIVWYRLYPETGEVEKLKEPPPGGSNFRDEGMNDIWRPMPDGSVSTKTMLRDLTAEVETRLKNKMADFSIITLNTEVENQLMAAIERRFRNGITADFSISTIMADIENQLRSEVEKYHLKPDVEKQIMEEAEKLLKASEKQLMTAVANYLKNKVAAEQKDKDKDGQNTK
jgi:hypothetical protein